MSGFCLIDANPFTPEGRSVSTQSMSLALVNGNVVTMNPSQPRAEAVAVRDGRIAYVGSSEKAEKHCPEGEVLDLEGRAVLPGLIDSHVHLMELGLSMLSVDARGVQSISELQDRVRAAARNAKKGDWIIGRGWDQELLREKRYPTRWDIDEAAQSNPVVLVRTCSHASVANSMALGKANLLAPRSVKGGRIETDSQGRPTGILFDSAMGEVFQAIPSPSKATLRKALLSACDTALREGVTCIHFMSCTPRDFDVMQELRRRSELPVRIRVYFAADHLDDAVSSSMIRDRGNDMLRVSGVKIMLDGSLGARTARLTRPYSDDPGNKGISLCSRRRLLDLLRKSRQMKLQAAVHAIGDEACAIALQALAAVWNDEAGLRQQRLEHASVLTRDLLRRMKRMRLKVSVQPQFILSDFWVVERVGPRRARFVYALRSLMDAGLTVAGGSDSPIERLSPFAGIYAAVTRGRFEGREILRYSERERLTTEQSLGLYTTNAASACLEDSLMGSVQPGKYGDLAVVAEDPMNVPLHRLKDLKVVMTVVAGKIAYSLGDESINR